jgi:hypothetical protein
MAEMRSWVSFEHLGNQDHQIRHLQTYSYQSHYFGIHSPSDQKASGLVAHRRRSLQAYKYWLSSSAEPFSPGMVICMPSVIVASQVIDGKTRPETGRFLPRYFVEAML